MSGKSALKIPYKVLWTVVASMGRMANAIERLGGIYGVTIDGNLTAIMIPNVLACFAIVWDMQELPLPCVPLVFH